MSTSCPACRPPRQDGRHGDNSRASLVGVVLVHPPPVIAQTPPLGGLSACRLVSTDGWPRFLNLGPRLFQRCRTRNSTDAKANRQPTSEKTWATQANLAEPAAATVIWQLTTKRQNGDHERRQERPHGATTNSTEIGRERDLGIGIGRQRFGHIAGTRRRAGYRASSVRCAGKRQLRAGGPSRNHNDQNTFFPHHRFFRRLNSFITPGQTVASFLGLL